MYNIYAYQNKIDGKIYIGQTKHTIEYRYKKGRKYRSSIYFGKAIKKYGISNFESWIITAVDTKERADQEEIYWIAEMRRQLGRDNVYNITDGGQGHRGFPGALNPFYGKHHTPETIKLLSVICARRGWKHRPESRLKCRLSHLGKKRTPAHCLAMSIARKGKPLTKRGTFKPCLFCQKLIYIRPKPPQRIDKKDSHSYCDNKCRQQHLSVRFSGNGNPNSKLDFAKAEELRSYYRGLNCKTVKEKVKLTKEKFQVGHKTIWEVITNKRWAPINDPNIHS